MNNVALRLPRRLPIGLPGEKEREILKISSRGENVAEDVDLDGITMRKGNFSRSDLKCVLIPPKDHFQLSLRF